MQALRVVQKSLKNGFLYGYFNQNELTPCHSFISQNRLDFVHLQRQLDKTGINGFVFHKTIK